MRMVLVLQVSTATDFIRLWMTVVRTIKKRVIL